MAPLIVFGLFLFLIIFGTPIGTALGIAGIGAILTFDLGTAMISRNFEANIAKFPLVAIPFFILAGNLMEKSRIVDGISRFVILLTGRNVGGLAIAGVITCIFWGAVSGSGPATAAALGLVFITPMIKQGYDKYFAASTIAAGAGLSIIIPPQHRLHRVREPHRRVRRCPVSGRNHPGHHRGDLSYYGHLLDCPNP